MTRSGRAGEAELGVQGLVAGAGAAQLLPGRRFRHATQFFLLLSKSTQQISGGGQDLAPFPGPLGQHAAHLFDLACDLVQL